MTYAFPKVPQHLVTAVSLVVIASGLWGAPRAAAQLVPAGSATAPAAGQPAPALPASAQTQAPAPIERAQPSSVIVPAPAGKGNSAPSQAGTVGSGGLSGGLPDAPSTVRTPPGGSLQRAAGSGVAYTAPSSAAGPGGLAIEKATDLPLPLTLDDAVSLALARNVRLRYDKGQQDIVKGYQLQVTNALLPDLTLTASSSAQEINLAAMGFNPQAIGPVLQQLGLTGGTFPTIVKINVTQAQVSTSQRLFDLPAFELYKGAKSEFRLVGLDILNDRGQVVLAAGQAYLKVLADQASLVNAVGQEATARTTYDQAVARREAGTGTNLDAVRAQVTLQQRQQDHISAETQLDKDGIQLNRIMGLPAGQPLDLTDTAPFATLADMDLEHARATAFVSRKDLLALEASIEVADREVRAIKYQRLPTLAFNGSYGVIGETTGLYHGVFNATGKVSFPIFREAGQRGEEEQAGSQLIAYRQREADLRVTIDSQIRSAMLDVESSRKLVEVGQSNVELANQELADERDRFQAGVDDNLPLVDAQASVTGAQAQLVHSLYQYNISKLMLASVTGVTESRYREYLGK